MADCPAFARAPEAVGPEGDGVVPVRVPVEVALAAIEVECRQELAQVEHEAGVEPDWIARLATLGGEDVGSALRLSNAESAAMTALHHTLQDAIRIEANAYRHGADAARRAALLSASASGTGLPDNLSERIAHGASARLPVSASDFIASGMTPGPALGDALARAETLWIDSLFSLDKPALLAEALS